METPSRGPTGLWAWFSKTLTRKFVLLLLGFFGLQVLQLAAGLVGVLHLGREGALINELGRQRARTLLIENHLRQAAAQGRWPKGGDAAYRQLRAEYERLLAVSDEMSRQDRTAWERALGEARAAWEKELRPALEGFDPADRAAAERALARYGALAQAQVRRFDRLVAWLEEQVREDSRRLAALQAALVAASLVLGAVGLLMARYVVSRPLASLIAAARAISAGAFDRRLPASGSDELGELARAFNRMAQAVGEKTRRISALNELALSLTSSLRLEDAFDGVMKQGIALLGCRAACVALYDEAAGCFREKVSQGLSEAFVRRMSFRPGGLADQAFHSGQYVVSNDRPDTAHKLSALAREEGIRGFICLPLVSQQRRLGVLYFYRSDRDDFEPEEIEVMQTFSCLAAQAISNARLYARMLDLAETDGLTGLPNRRKAESRLHAEIARAKRHDQPFSVALLDIDRFKRVNDTYGHAAGDHVLKTLAGVLFRELREVDLVARLGGEEFLVILPATDPPGARRTAERLRCAVERAGATLPGGTALTYTVSIGVASWPDDGETAELLLERADQALYMAKREGRNRTVVYSEMLKVTLERNPDQAVALLRRSADNIGPVAAAVDLKTRYTREHSRCTELAALALGRAMDLAPGELEALRRAAQLHDIGMLTVPDSVVARKGPLLPDEWAMIRRHPVVSAEIVSRVPGLEGLAPVVRAHHEHYDGSGYPDGLAGEAIPRLARVLAIADAYSALVVDRPQRGALGREEAMAAIEAGAGRLFDPHLVAMFGHLVRRSEV